MKVTSKEIVIENIDRKRKKLVETKLTKEEVYAASELFFCRRVLVKGKIITIQIIILECNKIRRD